MHIFRAVRPYVLAALALAAFASPMLALAAEPSVIAPAPSGAAQSALLGWLLSTLGPYVFPLLLTLAVALLGGLLHLVAVAIAHLKAGRVRHYLLAIADGARQGVAAVEQTLRPQLPDHLSPEEAQKLKDAALKAALDYVRTFGLDAVKGSLGLTDAQLAERLGVAIEAEVAAQSSSAPAAPERPREVVDLPSGGGKLVRPVPTP